MLLLSKAARLHSSGGGILLAALLLGLPIQGVAQFTGTLLLPRGSFELDARADFVEASRVFAEEGPPARLGQALLGTPLTAEVFPALVEEEERLRTLVGQPDTDLRAGTFSGRFEVNDQRAILRAGWGVLDRITVGASVPLVRRRIDAGLAARLDGANVGRNPSALSNMVEFRSALSGAMEDAQTNVDSVCQTMGSGSPECAEAQETLGGVENFVGELEAVLDEGFLFPLEGSTPGADLRLRWADQRAALAGLDVGAPEVLPLAVQAIRHQDVGTHLVGPVWGLDGFPLETPETTVEMGDLEAHLVLGLLDGSEIELPWEVRIRSSVEVTLRLGTGTPDSTALLAPVVEPRGVSGGGLRVVTDLVRPARLGLRTEMAWRTFRDGTGRLLGVDPEAPWNPAAARADVQGGPGDQLRISATPRFILAPGLSLGAGWQWIRMAEGQWATVASGEDAPSEVRRPALSQHRAALEFRFTGWELDVTPGVRFPVEVLGRASWTFAGSEDAARERRVEAGLRVRRDR
ncbi:MAG: hypothetical protein EA352_03045 [Gemmatimonadales bacterium]|nr:MAG: hypothetical protein EA352_03045 [Gemmatimonadales bacterium]